MEILGDLVQTAQQFLSCVGGDGTFLHPHHGAKGAERKTDFNQCIFMLLSSPQQGKLLVKSISF